MLYNNIMQRLRVLINIIVLYYCNTKVLLSLLLVRYYTSHHQGRRRGIPPPSTRWGPIHRHRPLVKSINPATTGHRVLNIIQRAPISILVALSYHVTCTVSCNPAPSREARAEPRVSAQVHIVRLRSHIHSQVKYVPAYISY